jgi:cysteine desulfurase / selenocysteine lyase
MLKTKTRNIIIIVAIFVAVIILVYFLSQYFKPSYSRSDGLRKMFRIKNDMVLLDNAASTLPFDHLFDILRTYSCFYSNIHRGTGMSSLLSSHCYEKSKDIVKEFVGAQKGYFVAYGKNATEQLNLLAAIIAQLYTNGIRKRSTIILTEMEHHSNDLPWRYLARIGMNIVYVGLAPNGDPTGAGIDYSDLQQKVNKYGQDLNIISVTGISNVTGIRLNIQKIGSLARSVGAYFSVDGAQLVPHTKVDMTALGIDFLAFSAHKIYCPFGLGALVGRENILSQLTESPLIKGGGEVKFVAPMTSLDFGVVWKSNEDLLEGGTQSIIGAVALANVLKTITKIGMDSIEEREAMLYSEAYKLFSTLGVSVVSPNPKYGTSSSILSFQTPSYDSALIGSILCYEYGICVRSGCMCAIIYVGHLLGKSDDDLTTIEKSMLKGAEQPLPGVVRISFAMYNNMDDVHKVYDAVKNILDGKIRYTYTKKGDAYVPDTNVHACECVYDKELKHLIEP